MFYKEENMMPREFETFEYLSCASGEKLVVGVHVSDRAQDWHADVFAFDLDCDAIIAD